MPCLESLLNLNISMSSADYSSPDLLRQLIVRGETIIILDCRSVTEFSRSHIKGAINVTLPSLMLRRLKKGNLNISCIIQNNEAKEKFNKSWKTHSVVLYDDCSTDTNANPSSVIHLLLKKLRNDGSKASFLLGGFSTFEERFPEYCVRQEDPNEAILGLCNLKIAEDSVCEAEDSGNPHMSPFPVEVIPHLFLGNAKNSADITQLKTYGIKYILNVTPNVPNMFENDSTFRYMQIPISDNLSQNLSSFFPKAISFIDEARSSGQGVLVHCLAGISRSVTVTMAYLMQKEDMTLNQAYDFVKKCKPNISPNFNFLGQLLEFQHILHGENSPCDNNPNCPCKNASVLMNEESKFPDVGVKFPEVGALKT